MRVELDPKETTAKKGTPSLLIAMLALGSCGDVQPYIGLGKGSKETGQVVRWVTHQNVESLVKSQGLEIGSVRSNRQNVIESQVIRELLEKGNFIAIMMRAVIQWTEDGIARAVEIIQKIEKTQDRLTQFT